MGRRKKEDVLSNKLVLRGFARVQIGDPSGKIVGDSGWVKNALTADGLDNYVAARVGSIAQGKNPMNLQLATQTAAFNTTQTSLTGETRIRVTAARSTVATGTLRMTGSWSSTDNGAAITIGAIGVYNISSGGTLGSGATFTASQWGTNQDVSASYEWRFSTA